MCSPCGRVASAALLSMASAHHFPRDVKYLPPTPPPPLLVGWEIFSPSLPPPPSDFDRICCATNDMAWTLGTFPKQTRWSSPSIIIHFDAARSPL